MSRRGRVTVGVLVGVFLLFTLLGWGIDAYTDLLWFREVDFTDVFTGVLFTRLLLFLAVGLAMALIIAGNLYLAYRLRPLLRPHSAEQATLERYRMVIAPRLGTWIAVIGLVIGFFAGLSAQSRWKDWMLFQNGGSFGVRDPQFNVDIGFYIFDYPLWRYLLGVGFTAVVLSVIGALAVHYIFGGVRLQGVGDRMTSAARAHLTTLVAVFVLLKAVAYILDRRALLLEQHVSPGLYGAGYTDVNALLPAKEILAYISIVVAIAIIVFSNAVMRNLVWPGVALALLAISAVAIGGIYPLAVQNFTVQPSLADKEAPYIQRSINATRAAFGLQDTEIRPYAASNTVPPPGPWPPTPARRTSGCSTRSWSPRRSPSSSRSEASTTSGRSWTWTGTRSTPAHPRLCGRRPRDQRRRADRPAAELAQPAHRLHPWLRPGGGAGQPGRLRWSAVLRLRLPRRRPAARLRLGLRGDQDRSAADLLRRAVHRVRDRRPDRPANRKVEFDRPQPNNNNAEERYTYEGEGGVPIGSFFRQLVFAIKNTESNFVLSDAVNDNSRLMYVRDPRSRVEKVAPFLTIDGDPYPAVVDGRIQWILDGYTTSATYPYSQRVNLQQETRDETTNQGTFALARDNVNYMRNSVKATVDAYDGTVKLYEFDDQDPILKAWNKAFGGDLIMPKAETPAALEAHFRYPADMFKVQRNLLARFHVTNPAEYFSGQDFWQVPNTPDAPQQNIKQPPFYLNVQLPGQEATRFQLTSAVTPNNRDNLAAIISGSYVDNKPRLEVLELPDQTAIQGPVQVHQRMTNNATVRSELTLLSNSNQSQVLYGNLISLPVGDGMLYVEPVYVKSGQENAVPLLQKVLMSYGDGGTYVVLANSLKAGSGRAGRPGQGVRHEPAGETTNTPPKTGNNGTPPPALTGQLAEAAAELDQAIDERQGGAGVGRLRPVRPGAAGTGAGDDQLPERPARGGRRHQRRRRPGGRTVRVRAGQSRTNP